MIKTILVAEDHPELSGLFQEYLQRSGYRVLTATGGVECARIIREEAPDVIVASTDMLWGGADGLVNYLQDEFQMGWIPSVVLTGCVEAEAISEISDQPCVCCYLRKPFTMQRLLDCVRSAQPESPPSRVLTPQLWP
jgi:CheY-like chemotaxis protein